MGLISYLQRQRVVRETAAVRRIAQRAEDAAMQQPQEAKVQICVGDADPRTKVLRYGERSVIAVEVYSEDGRVGPFTITLELKDIK